MTEKVEIEGEEYEVEIANNFFTRAKGLSFRTEGKMLFKFSRDTRASIDMMLVSEPLFLYFLDSSGEVIESQHAEPWTVDPRTWRLYSPEKSYRYLLESFKDLDLEEGDQISF